MPKISSELNAQVRKGSEMTGKVLNSVRATLVKSCLGSNVGCWCFLVNSRSPVLTRNPLMRANFENFEYSHHILPHQGLHVHVE